MSEVEREEQALPIGISGREEKTRLVFIGSMALPVRSCFPLPIPTASIKILTPTVFFKVKIYSSNENFSSSKVLETYNKICAKSGHNIFVVSKYVVNLAAEVQSQ